MCWFTYKYNTLHRFKQEVDKSACAMQNLDLPDIAEFSDTGPVTTNWQTRIIYYTTKMVRVVALRELAEFMMIDVSTYLNSRE